MRKLLLILSLAILIAGIAVGLNKKSSAALESVNVEKSYALLNANKNTIILDVRTPEEYAEVHIDGAINVDISEDNFSTKITSLDKNKTYIVHCAANVENGRTAKSMGIMKELGYAHLINMEGGIIAWEKSGLPVVRSE